MMLLAVILGHLPALLAKMCLKGRVHEQLLSDRVPSQLPGELVAKLLLMLLVRRVDDLVVVLLQLLVILLDGVRDLDKAGAC